jgi:2-haloacid dehalogenase
MWVLFDLNGTLVDPSVLADPPHAVHEALDEANVMAMIAELGGGARPVFAELLDGALRRRLALAGADPSRAGPALERLATMPAYPDAPAALERLRAGGLRLAVLTQSASAAAERVLAASGLREAFELVLSAPESGAYKPTASAYRGALERCGTSDAWFVAGHWWDIAGAANAGLRTAWVSRTDRLYPAGVAQPDVRGEDLIAAANGILGHTDG